MNHEINPPSPAAKPPEPAVDDQNAQAGFPNPGQADQPIPPETIARVRRRLRILFTLLMVVLVGVLALFARYLLNPAPLPDLLPVPASMVNPPHYVFSMYSLDQPVSVAVSPDGERLYVAETGGDRLIKIINRDGDPIGAFAAPNTAIPERAPVYLAVAPDGRVFASDRAQHAVYVFDADGNYLDTLLSPGETLSEYLYTKLGRLPEKAQFIYNHYQGTVFYKALGATEQTLSPPPLYDWAPLGVRIDAQGRLLLTNVIENRSVVYVYPSRTLTTTHWTAFEPPALEFGEFGAQAGQFTYPNSVVSDSRGRFFVVDGNNSRISVWDKEGNFLFNFGRGTGIGAINLPRGAAIDKLDRLYVVDAVGQSIKVYDVSGEEVGFLFAFGDFGSGDGLFNYPNDITLAKDGRIYIADRENNRVQVWLY